MRRLLGILCAVAALRAGADTLGDMKAAVGRLTAKEPVRGTFSTEAKVKAAGKFANENSNRVVATEVGHDAAGVSIVIPQALIDKDDRNAIGSLRSTEIVEALDFRGSLLSMLENATLAAERRVVLHGHPARLLELTLHPRPRRESGTIRIGSVKTDDRMTLWIGDDNLPLAAERTQKSTGGIMFLHATYVGRMSYTFAHTADRLILARLETNDSGSGMGQNIDKTGLQTLTLH